MQGNAKNAGIRGEVRNCEETSTPLMMVSILMKLSSINFCFITVQDQNTSVDPHLSNLTADQ